MLVSMHAKTRHRMPAARRRQFIREELSRNNVVSIAALASELEVSEMTIRRDLEVLQEGASIQRTHGGAVLAERMVFEFDYRARQRSRLEQKLAIATEAASRVKSGERVILDTGTTTLQLARLLKDKEHLTIITPSLAVASELQFSENLEVILLGGKIHKGSPDLTGPVTEHCLELFAADWVFQGAEAIGLDGSIYNVDLQLAQVDRRMRMKARRAFLLSDSSKIGSTALVKTGNLVDYDGFITDSEAPDDFLALARRLVPEVHVVSA